MNHRFQFFAIYYNLAFDFYNLNMTEASLLRNQLNLNFSPIYRPKIKRVKSLDSRANNLLDFAFEKLVKRINKTNKAQTTFPGTQSKHSFDKHSKRSLKDPNKQNSEEEAAHQYLSMKIMKPRKLFVRTQIKLCNFVLGAMVGSGTFGDVFLCKQRMTGTCYAIKKIMKSTIKSYKLQSQMLNQIKIHGCLDHPNIVKFYGCFDDEYHIFLLSEFANEGMLLKYFKKGQKFTSKVLDSIINAILYLQTKNIIHRDIKPQNIVMINGVPKLCDFGWAAVCDSSRKTFCGTLDYVCPEILQNKEYDASVDMWSIGVLCYELLVGEPPFKHKHKPTKMDLIKNVQTSLNIPPWLSEEAKDFIKRTLEKDPGVRLSAEQAKNHPLILKYHSKKK